MYLKTDRFISLKETNHNNPYDDEEFLKYEDIVGYVTLFKLFASDKIHERDIKSLRSYRNKIRKKICGDCKRHKNGEAGIAPYCIPITIKRLNTYLSAKKKKKCMYDFHTIKLATCDGCRVLELKKALTSLTKWYDWY